jgi:CxxC-x17-CxxC domain-containing protein
MSQEEINDNLVTYFAQTNYRNKLQKFGIRQIDRRRHFYILGKTGSGKTTLMANMALQDIENGNGLAVVDPHGDVLSSLLDYIPSNRVNDVIYVNPVDSEYPIAFNVLENVQDEQKHLVASGLMSVFKKIWANLWSARMEHIMRNCILALLEVPGNTLLGIMRLLVDKNFRKKIIDNVSDPVVKSFWVDEYANWNDRFRVEAIQPIQNKVGQFLSSAIIRNLVGQPKSTLDLRSIMDNRQILLMDLSKGRLGEDNSNLLGAMLITKLWLAAMSRVDTPEEDRKDFFLHVDEFQNFATESFADILSEARKYRLNLTIAHQYIAQLVTPDSHAVKDAVFGNVGTICCFRMGAADARDLIKEFEPLFLEEDLVNIGKHEVILKLMIDGMASQPFTGLTLAPLSTGKKNNNKEKVIKVSRERYARPRAEVEEKILRWSGLEETMKEAGRVVSSSESKENMFKPGVKDASFVRQTTEDDKEKYDAFCDSCGTKTQINFIPDLSKAIFCKDCLKEFRRGAIDPLKLKSKNEHLKKIKEEKKVEIKKPAVLGSTVKEKIETKPFIKTTPIVKKVEEKIEVKTAIKEEPEIKPIIKTEPVVVQKEEKKVQPIIKKVEIKKPVIQEEVKPVKAEPTVKQESERKPERSSPTRSPRTEPERIVKTTGKAKVNLLIDKKETKEPQAKEEGSGLSLDSLKDDNKAVSFSSRERKVSPGQKVDL